MQSTFDWLMLRFISTAKQIDKVIEIYRWLVSELVLAFASDRVLDTYTEGAYNQDTTYRPSHQNFRHYLFPWEEKTIAAFFPAPPARILVGAAGGGREVLALLQRGYEVVAFEPSKELIHTLQKTLSDDAPAHLYQGRYEQLPRLYSLDKDQHELQLGSLGCFDAAIIGWGSFVHLRNEEQRVHALKHMASVTKGPLLVSFFMRNWDQQEEKLGRFRRLIRGRYNQDPGNFFYKGIGFHHYTSQDEFIRLVHKSGLKLQYINIDTRDTNWPHAIVCNA